jgi:hypothetical protein
MKDFKVNQGQRGNRGTIDNAKQSDFFAETRGRTGTTVGGQEF